MSDINSRATVELVINGANAKQEIEAIKKRSEELRKKMDQCTLKGDDKGARKFQRQLEQTEKRLQKIKNAQVDVLQTLNRLDKASLKDLQNTLKNLEKGLRSMERGTAAWDRQNAAIKRVKAEIAKVNAEMRVVKQEHVTIVQRINNVWSKWQTTILGVTAAMTGLVMAGRKAVNAYAEMEQEMANVRKYTGMDESDVLKLNEALKKIDTRTSREELNRLAQEAGRLGKSSQEDVLGYVRAADKINVALDELGEGATLTLSKLTSIFGDETRLGTEKALLSVGSVVNELSQNCSASAPYITEFASRMGGVAAQAGLTVQQIMAFGAVLDSNNQKLEASSTALSQVIVRIYQDPAKYARVAGLNVKEFCKLVQVDMNKALLEFLSALNRAGNMNVLSPMFKDMGENGSRAIAALSTLANHIDAVKSQQYEANKAYSEAVSIDKEFNVQNNTVMAGIEKAKKKLNEIAVELGQKLSPILKYVYSSSSLLLRLLSVMVSFIIEHKKEIALLTVSIIAYNVSIHSSAIVTGAANAAMKAWAVTTKAMPALLALFRVALVPVVNSIQYFTNGLQVNYAMQLRWRKAVDALVAAGPAKVFIAASVAAVALGKALMSLITRYNSLSEVSKTMNSIKEDAAKNAALELEKVRALMKAADDYNKTEEERLRICDKLNSIVPGMSATIDKLTGRFVYATEAVNKYNASLIRMYEIQGAKDKIKELARTRAELTIEKNDLEEQNRSLGQQRANNASSRANTSSGNAPAAPFVFMNYSAQQAGINARLEKVNTSLGTVDKQLEAIYKTYGIANLYDVNEPAEPDAPDSSARSHTGKGKGRGGGSNSNHDKFELEKKWREKMEAEAKIAYETGEIDYEQYMIKLDWIEINFYKKQLENKKITENEKLKITADMNEAQNRVIDHYNDKIIKSETDYHNKYLAELKQMYIDGELSKKTFDMAMENEELRFQMVLAHATKQGTKARAEEEAKYQELLLKYQEEKQKKFAELVSSYSKIYELKSLKEKYDAELDLLEELHSRSLVSEEEYQQMRLEIRKKYEVDTLPESAMQRKTELQELEEQRNRDMERLQLMYDQKLISEKDFLEAKDNLNKFYEKRNAERIGKSIEDSKRLGNEFSSMMINLYQSIAEIGDAKNFTEKIGKIATAAQAAFAIVNACWQTYSEYSKAELDLEVARIERRYDAEAKLAEGNVYKQKKAEHDRQTAIAAAKNEAARKEYAMQITMAIAQSAMAAISAYSSAAAVPVVGYILAPIAAAMAAAAGAAQVATIRKQKQTAEATGYMLGGFTPSGDKKKEVGVVHAGEWVAPQEMVNNPSYRPMINFLEYARKNNRMPSITSRDVSMYSAAPAARQLVQTPNIVVEAPRQENGQIDELSGVIDRLNRRLEQPFVTINTVSGDYGSEKVKEEYNRLMRNKSK